MPTYSVTYESTTSTHNTVSDAHFGANALHDVNITEGSDFAPNEGFEAAIEALDITHLRYPGGLTESEIDITQMSGGALRDEVASFLDWAAEKRIGGAPLQITLCLPTKTDVSSDQITEFVTKVLTEYGDLIAGFEIGNEYSIGTASDDADRSEHPETSGGIAYAMGETEYGIVANRVINATQAGIDAAAEQMGTDAVDPDIMLQMAEMTGAGSDYKGTGLDSEDANQDIIDQLSDSAIASVDTVVIHYYYNDTHDDDIVFDDGWQEVRNLDDRVDTFMDVFGRDIDLAITEWAVYKKNSTQLGATAASTMLEMFENMIDLGADSAYVWPLQHRTANAIAGNRNADDAYLTMAGAAFDMMSEALRASVSVETGATSAFALQDTVWSGASDSVEINHYASDYETVLYVSLRDLEQTDLSLSLGGLMDGVTHVSVQQLTMDRTSSDGLSDVANNGDGRLAKPGNHAGGIGTTVDIGFLQSQLRRACDIFR